MSDDSSASSAEEVKETTEEEVTDLSNRWVKEGEVWCLSACWCLLLVWLFAPFLLSLPAVAGCAVVTACIRSPTPFLTMIGHTDLTLLSFHSHNQQTWHYITPAGQLTCTAKSHTLALKHIQRRMHKVPRSFQNCQLGTQGLDGAVCRRCQGFGFVQGEWSPLIRDRRIEWDFGFDCLCLAPTSSSAEPLSRISILTLTLTRQLALQKYSVRYHDYWLSGCQALHQEGNFLRFLFILPSKKDYFFPKYWN